MNLEGRGGNGSNHSKSWVTLVSSIIGAAAVIWAAVISVDAKRDLQVKDEEIRQLQEQSREKREGVLGQSSLKQEVESLKAALAEKQSEAKNLHVKVAEMERRLNEKSGVKQTSVSTTPHRDLTPAPAPPSAESTPVRNDTKKGVRIDLIGCQLSGSRVNCSATMTQTRDGYNHVIGGSDGSYIWDMQGNQYPLSRVKLGAKEGGRRVDSELPANTPTRVELVFEGVPSNLRRIRTLVIATYQQNFTFPDIDLTR